MWDSSVFYSNTVAFALKSVLDAFQIGSMLKLIIEVKLAAGEFTPEKAKKQFKWNKIFSITTGVALVMASCFWSTR